MRLHCRECDAPVRAEDVDLERMLAKCRACDAVFGFTVSDVDPARAALPRAGAAGGPDRVVPRPAKVRVEESAARWEATWRWFEWYHVALLVFSLLPLGFIAFWYTMLFRMSAQAEAQGDAPPRVFLLAFVAVPLIFLAGDLVLLYSVLAGFVNHTTVRVTRDTLSIRHRPLPWRGDRRMAAGEITQLYCEPAVTGGEGQSFGFRLSAVLHDGRKQPLLSGFTAPEVPLFLEQQLEQRMGIVPRAVVGEYRR